MWHNVFHICKYFLQSQVISYLYIQIINLFHSICRTKRNDLSDQISLHGRTIHSNKNKNNYGLTVLSIQKTLEINLKSDREHRLIALDTQYMILIMDWSFGMQSTVNKMNCSSSLKNMVMNETFLLWNCDLGPYFIDHFEWGLIHFHHKS